MNLLEKECASPRTPFVILLTASHANLKRAAYLCFHRLLFAIGAQKMAISLPKSVNKERIVIALLSNMEFITIWLFGPCALLFLDLNKNLF